MKKLFLIMLTCCVVSLHAGTDNDVSGKNKHRHRSRKTTVDLTKTTPDQAAKTLQKAPSSSLFSWRKAAPVGIVLVALLAIVPNYTDYGMRSTEIDAV